MPLMILLDTHIWHWWTNQIPDRLPASLIDRIERAESVAISAISVFEMAWLVRHKRVDLGMAFHEWLQLVRDQSDIDILPVNAEIAEIAVALPEHHKDPQDRLIIASALHHGLSLVSFDQAFEQYEVLAGRLINRKT
jgi:PIN domain nuclease of toxin-antitoxin system